MRVICALLMGGLGLAVGLGCAEAHSAFDGERAFEDLRAQVEIGPRPAGSSGAVRTRQLIRERIQAAGWSLEEQAFSVTRPDGEVVSMVNLIATRPGRTPNELILAAHYDTKEIEGIRFVGANDGASGVALLLELARALGPEPGPLTMRLAFFDGEEAFGGNITQADGLYGSRDLAMRMAQSGTLERVRALVLFDMIADRDLNLAVDSRSSERLRGLLREVAPDLVDTTHRLSLIDDHVPFLERGVREVLALIDFQYGARSSPGPFWHTERDDLEAVSADSLARVGAAALRLIRRLEDLDRDLQSEPSAKP